MQSAAILSLIADGVRRGTSGQTAWADFGSGDGAFTRVLRERLGPDADIYAVDVDASKLRRHKRAVESQADARRGQGQAIERTHFVERDFTEPIDLPPLDGVLMANALHFVERQTALLKRVRAYLKPSGTLLVVEYDIKRASPWVPYPVSFERFAQLAPAAGFHDATLLRTAPARYWNRMYSALALSRERS